MSGRLDNATVDAVTPTTVTNSHGEGDDARGEEFLPCVDETASQSVVEKMEIFGGTNSTGVSASNARNVAIAEDGRGTVPFP